MYANLTVTVHHGKGGRQDEILSAWRVATSGSGNVYVYTDLNDGTGNYAEQGPVRLFPAGTLMTIDPSF